MFWVDGRQGAAEAREHKQRLNETLGEVEVCNHDEELCGARVGDCHGIHDLLGLLLLFLDWSVGQI